MPSAVRTPVALAALCLSLAAGPARSEGLIVTTGATIEAGDGVPAGTVTIDDCAGPKAPPVPPEVGGFGAIGPLNGGSFPFPGGGTGALGAFSAAINTTQTLPGGTYDYTTYTVGANAVVTYSGAVTIRTTGNVQIEGQVGSAAAGASVTILCGGDLQIAANPYGTTRDGIRTTGSNAQVTVHAQGALTASSPDSSRSEIRSFASAVWVLSNSLSSMTLTNCDLRSPSNVTVRARGPLAATGAVVDVTDGDVLLAAYGGAAAFDESTVTAYGDLTIDGFGGVRLLDATDVHGEGVLSIRGYGDPSLSPGTQDVVIDDSSVSNFTAIAKTERALVAGKDLSILSAAGVRLSTQAYVNHEGTGDIVLTAFGGSVLLEHSGSTDQSDVCHGGTGSIVLSGTKDVLVAGSSLVDASDGDVVLQALEEGVKILGDGLVRAARGTADLRAGGSVTIARDAVTGGTEPIIMGDAFLVAAGAGGIDANVADLSAVEGAGRVVSTGPVRLRGLAKSLGALTIQSVTGPLDLANASLSTLDDDVHATSAVTVECYSGTGSIDVTDATILSGESAAKSGDVRIALHSVPGPVVNAYILPSKVAVKVHPTDAAKSSLTASGVIDLGSGAPSLGGDATLTIGDAALAVNLVAGKKGVVLHKDATVDFQVARPSTGTSKASFKLKYTGDLTGLVDDQGRGPLLLRLESAGLKAECTVTLAAWKFAYGKTRGALAEPSFFVLRTSARASGPGADTLQVVAGLATDGTTPSAAPDVRVSFGPAFDVRIPSSAFGPAVKDRFTAVKPLPGIALVVLDYKKETITVKGSKLTLGSFDGGPSVPVSIGLSLDADNRSVDVRMARKNAASFGY
jgi:hypothetical protein